VNGNVDEAARALIGLSLRVSADSETKEVVAWIDTAFNGELVVPRTLIESLQLSQSAAIAAKLADGTEVVLETYHCFLEWFGSVRAVEVIGNDGQFHYSAQDYSETAD
jgi:predicted aspartyl protease